VVEQAQEKLGSVAGQAQQLVGQVTDQAKGQATSQLETQKDRAAERLETASLLLLETGEHLRGKQHGTTAGYVDQAAEQAERLANYVRSRDVAQLMQDTQQLARKRPGLFLGGALALGFLGSRFLQSSGQRAAEARSTAQSSAATASSTPSFAGSAAPSGSAGLTGRGVSHSITSGAPTSRLVSDSSVPTTSPYGVSKRPATGNM